MNKRDEWAQIARMYGYRLRYLKGQRMILQDRRDVLHRKHTASFSLDGFGFVLYGHKYPALEALLIHLSH